VLRRPSSRPRAYRTRRPAWVYWVRRGVLLSLVVLVLSTTWSIADALRAPGDDGVSVKLAEWARDHYLGPAVTLAENIQYRLSPPQTGGAPDTSQLAAAAAEKATSGQNASVIKALAPIVPPVSPALPGEGVYVPVVRSTKGPLIQVTFVRPDTVHTSYLTGVAWMSRSLRFVLHPGFQDPGLAGMSQPDTVANQQAGLVATFNGGFKIKDAQGGYYDHGRTAGTLTPGAASFVVYKDGHATVGTWGQDVSMTPDVAFVRQNLQPLVTGGKVAANLGRHDRRRRGGVALRHRGHGPGRPRLRDGRRDVGVRPRRHPASRGRGDRDAARHQPGLGVLHVLHPQRVERRAAQARQVPAAGRPLLQPREPGLHLRLRALITRACRSGRSGGQARRARCRATMPPWMFIHSTPDQPASWMRSARVLWSGHAAIDSAR
jgi:hypothetical protein